MKKFLMGFLICAILTSSVAFAANFSAVQAGFKILVNGGELQSDKPPVVINGSTYLPLKAIGNALKYPVNWNDEKKQVDIGCVAKDFKIDDNLTITIYNHGYAVNIEGGGAIAVDFEYKNTGSQDVDITPVSYGSASFVKSVSYDTKFDSTYWDKKTLKAGESLKCSILYDYLAAYYIVKGQLPYKFSYPSSRYDLKYNY